MTGKLVAAAIVLGVVAADPAAAAAFNTALSQAEADEIMNRHCSLQRGYAQQAAPGLRMPWDEVNRRAYEVLRANMDTPVLQNLIRQAESQAAGGSKGQRDMAEFQVCLLDNKIAYAEAHERQANR